MIYAYPVKQKTAIYARLVRAKTIIFSCFIGPYTVVYAGLVRPKTINFDCVIRPDTVIYADTKSEICWSYITEMENMPAVHRQKAKKKKSH